MIGEIHKEAAKSHLKVGEEFYKKMQEESDTNKKTANMIVSAQNYFYCSVNVIEYILFKEKKEHSFNHENRFRKVKEYFNIFPSEFAELYDKVDRDLRNKVAYRGENSEKFESLKKLAESAIKLL
ncbi:hypothetical protein CMO89_04395 [Candidatus Woesearchaeota archaeon]|nr:hypothetical protein [Candidatus Woesearchaeota archaeon]|tara:strand:- start:9953 stop:10327 length:375 start_codon:yes stop_codon:yes gene_type:complete